nr:hypothetical protein JCGZ_09609 [Ipomoea trifida]
MRELKAMAINARKDIVTAALAISGNLSFPQFNRQSSTRVAAEDDADIRRVMAQWVLEKVVASGRVVPDENRILVFRLAKEKWILVFRILDEKLILVFRAPGEKRILACRTPFGFYENMRSSNKGPQ